MTVSSQITIRYSVNSWRLSLLLMWLIFSYKAWGALLGRRLAERGIIVACIDYRCWCLKEFCDVYTTYVYFTIMFSTCTFLINFEYWLNDLFLLHWQNLNMDGRNFPQGTISDMVSDASEAISFICNNVVSFGGDPNK